MNESLTIHHAIHQRSSPPSRRPPGVWGAPEAVAARKILVVEDESIVGWALRCLLEDMGHEVVDVVPTGLAAIAAAAEHRPELVFMDINLGRGMNGIEAAERIAAAGPVRLIFVTAYGDRDTAARIAERLPGALLISKPVSLPSVQAAIARLYKPGN